MKTVIFADKSDLGVFEMLKCRFKSQVVFVRDWPGGSAMRHRFVKCINLRVTNLVGDGLSTSNVLSMTEGFGLSAPEAMAQEVSERLFQVNALVIPKKAVYPWLVARYRHKMFLVTRLWPWFHTHNEHQIEVVLSDGELVKLCSIEPKFQDIKFRRPIFTSMRLVTKTMSRVSREVFKRLKVRLKSSKATAPPRDCVARQDTGGQIMFVLHTGMSYGSLYDWGFWFRQEKNSPLNQQRVQLATYDDRCPLLINGQAVHVMPHALRLLGKDSISDVVWIALRASILAMQPHLFFSAFALAKTCAMAHKMAVWLEASFPHLRVALFGYDILTPRWVSWGFEFAGIETVAAQERPASAVSPWATVSVGSYLASGPLFAQAIADNPGNAVKNIGTLGQYRTDQIQSANTSTAPRRIKQVLVLPYHLDEEAESMFNVTSIVYTRHLMGEIIRVARKMPDLHFVVRSKSLDIFESNMMEDIYATIPVNLELDRNIHVMHSAYQRLQESSLIIGKTTSLIDEALAADIPALHIDYGLWGDREMVDGYTYLPRQLWAQDFEDLIAKMAWALEDDGQTFKKWWSPHRHRIYGDLVDGNVRERARSYVEALLVNNSN